jgi:hypothetical protein
MNEMQIPLCIYCQLIIGLGDAERIDKGPHAGKMTVHVKGNTFDHAQLTNMVCFGTVYNVCQCAKIRSLMKNCPELVGKFDE